MAVAVRMPRGSPKRPVRRRCTTPATTARSGRDNCGVNLFLIHPEAAVLSRHVAAGMDMACTLGRVRESFRDTESPADPYPGARPEHSLVHSGRTCWPVRADPSSPSGWVVEPGETDLDDWLS